MHTIKKVLFILSTIVGSFCQAQTIKTPEAFSFEQEVFRPISYYTGQANISIPLTQIQTNEITIPVTLNYVGGGGLRAINPYSSAGMGWRITAGGAITRTKNGVCDESTTTTNGDLKGFFSLTPNSVTNSYVRNNVNSYTYIIGNGLRQFTTDTEYSPDVFSFSFLGYSGFFVMGYDGQFKIQSQDINLVEKINAPWPWPGIGNCVAFRLTANDGTIFTFGSTNGSIELSGGNGGVPFQCDAWYLTKIEFTNGRTISFNYQPNINPTVPIIYYKASSESSTNSAVSPVVLDNIIFNEGKVVFSSSQITQYIVDQPSFTRMIDKIELKDANNKIINTASFTRSWENLQRYYFLDNVTIDGKKYSFEYYKRSQLPTINQALGQDYWGFYNGETEVTSIGLGAVSSFWDTYLNPTVTYPARMPSVEYAKRGILTSITYPTGGVEAYEYEANTYSNVGKQANSGTIYEASIEPKIAGGLRIAKITLGDMVRKFKYVTSFDPDNPDYDPQTMSPIGFSSSGILYRLPGIPYFGRNALNSLSIDGEPPIVYSKVIEFLSDKSYTEYTMRSPLDKQDKDNNQNTNYFSVWSSDPNIFNYFPKLAFVGSLGKSSSCSLERGQVSSIKVYDASNTLRKSTVYAYTADPNQYDEYVASLNLLGGDQGMLKLGWELGDFYLQKHVTLSIAHSYCIYTFPVYLEQVVETSYEGGNTLEQTIKYEYNAKKLKSAITTYNSSGDIIKTVIKYPADVNTGIYASMVSKKMLNFPVEQIQFKNNTITAGKLTTYKANGSSYVPDKKYSLEITTPFPETPFTYFNGTAKDSHYGTVPEMTYNTYDNFGNLISGKGKDGVPVSYQWAYGSQYPVVEVKNAENTLTNTTTTGTAYGSLSMPSSSASTSFTTSVSGNIVLSIQGDPGNTYAIYYTLTGAGSGSGVLCASRSSTTCSYPETVTLTGKPAGTYTLSISLYSGSASYKGVNYNYQKSQTVTTGALEYFYQGFEEEIGAATGGAFAGKKYYNGDYTVPFTIPNSRSYMVNYRYLDGGIWKNMTKTFTSNMTLTEGTAIDEVRVYPSDALMTTYTYNPLVGITSSNDANGFATFYYYDGFGRLILIRDQDKNVLKSICYNYSGQPGNCGIYGNQVMPKTIRKNNCTGCQAGSYVTYTIPANTYFGSSQDEANALAGVDLDANAQNYANLNGTCSTAGMASLVSTNSILNKSFTVVFHNNCTNSNYNYTLNQNTSNVTLSPQLPTGNYNVSFAPVGGSTTSYSYWVNGFVDYGTTGNILGVDIVSGSNQVRITP